MKYDYEKELKKAIRKQYIYLANDNGTDAIRQRVSYIKQLKKELSDHQENQINKSSIKEK